MMTSNFNRVSTLVSGFFLACAMLLLSLIFAQPAEAAKCIDDPGGSYFNVALNSVIRDGQLVVDQSLAETQPPLHWTHPAIRFSWTPYPGAKGYILRRHDAKSAENTEYYATKANNAETMLTTTTAVRPNHASAKRAWYVDVITADGERIDASSVYSIEVMCSTRFITSSSHMTAELLTESVGSDPAPDTLPYPVGTWINHSEWNPYVKRILAERRAAEPAPATPAVVPPVTTTTVPASVPTTTETVVPPVSTPTAPRKAALTAEFRDVPSTHDGAGEFIMELHFSENLDLSYKTVRDSVLQVTNGQITGARRYTPGSNRGWLITVQPTAARAIEISLPVALPDGTKLSSGLTASTSLQQQTQETSSALTAEFRDVPSTHNGTSRFIMELHFSENIPGLSYKTVRDSVLQVTNGQITGARRYTPGSNRNWLITVQPTAARAIEVSLPVAANCQASGSICLPDGTKLSSGLTASISPE